jgi:hypothetical protein
VRHVSGHRVVAMIEVVSPGNKNNRHGIRSFVAKAVEMLRAGVHLLILDLFPPGELHPLIWEELIGPSDFALPDDSPLTMAAYVGGPEAFVEPRAVGGTLPEMPLFLTPEVYVKVPLEATYTAAWEGMPAYRRGVVASAPAP